MRPRYTRAFTAGACIVIDHADRPTGRFFGPATLVELLTHRAACQGDDRAFTFLVDGEREEVHLTYRELDRQAPVLSDGAVRALLEYSWPGNVRELENLMQRLVVMTDEKEIGVHLLPPAMRFCTSGDAFSPCTLAEVEAEHIRQVLALVAGNKTRAAEILGIDRKTLREKLKRYSNEKQPRK